jgi:bifunctional non-homologous end joining protein LigD
VLRLPEPMFTKAGPVPAVDGWLFEPKLDGFRCLVCTHGGRFRARSRRGWDMSSAVPELAQRLPADVQLDGELVAWDEDGRPDFHLLRPTCPPRPRTDSTLIVFDVLALEGVPTITQP